MSDAPSPAPTSARSVVVTSLGVGLATGAYGVSFGAIATVSGLDVWQTCALSLLMFTGASQFAFVGVVGAGGAPIAAAVTAALAVRGWRKVLAAHVVLDESTAVSVAQDDPRHARIGFYVTGAAVFVLWNVMTLAGAVAGTALGDPRRYGLDAAVGAAFLALLWPRLSAWPQRLIALLAAAIAVGLVPLTPSGAPIIAAGTIAVLVGLRTSGPSSGEREPS
jgi:predicted branched-subunit amino acid permease